MKLVGTGTDPMNRYAKDVVYDVPDDDVETAEDHLQRGWARLPNSSEVEPSVVQVANAIVRGDALLLPEEANAAEEVGDRAHAVAHTSDPNAEQSVAAPRKRAKPTKR